MKKHLIKSNMKIILIMAVLLMTTIACSMGGVTIDKNKATIEVTLTEDQVNKLLTNAQVDVEVSAESLLKKVTSVEMHDGYVRVFGEDQLPDGTPVQGSFDVSVNAANDELKIQILSVNIPGVSMNDPRIIEANAELEKALSKAVSNSYNEVLFKEASATEAGLKLKMEVKLEQK